MVSTLLSVAVKGMIPVVIAASLFGCHWNSEIVEFIVDDAAVVAVLKPHTIVTFT